MPFIGKGKGKRYIQSVSKSSIFGGRETTWAICEEGNLSDKGDLQAKTKILLSRGKRRE